jgi:hypothetical protein
MRSWGVWQKPHLGIWPRCKSRHTVMFILSQHRAKRVIAKVYLPYIAYLQSTPDPMHRKCTMHPAVSTHRRFNLTPSLCEDGLLSLSLLINLSHLKRVSLTSGILLLHFLDLP